MPIRGIMTPDGLPLTPAPSTATLPAAPPTPVVPPAPPLPAVSFPPPSPQRTPFPGEVFIPGEDIGAPPGTLVAPPPFVGTTGDATAPPATGEGATIDDPDFAAAKAEADANDPDNSDLPADDVIDLAGLVEFSTESAPLKGGSALEAIAQGCADFGLDTRAVCGDALGEGAGGGIGDGGRSYGPFQMEIGGALPEPYASRGLNNPTTNAWAWSRNGIRYALKGMCTAKPSARGLLGHAAVYAIVYGFERPTNEAAAYKTRSGYYDDLVTRGDQWVDYMATRLAGPAGVSATDTQPQTPTASGTPKPTAVNHDWKNLLDVFITKLPEGNASIKSNSEGMVNIFR